MKKNIGVLGGLGPQTTAHFYTSLVEKATRSSRPGVCIWSLPLNLRKESEYIASGQHADHFLSLMTDGVRALEKAGSQFIVIPCNTVHEFHDTLSLKTGIRIVNLIEVVTDEVERRGWKKVLLLATSRTLHTKLYQHSLGQAGVEIVIPESASQKKLDLLIQGLLGNKKNNDSQNFLESLALEAGADKIVLGCTDLQLLFASSESVIDSMEILAVHTASLVK